MVSINTTVLPKFIPLKEAIKKTNLPAKTLQYMIEVGKIKVAEVNGQIFVKEKSLPKTPSQKKMPNFITMQEAIKKSNLSQKEIQSMLDAGKINGGKINGVVVVSEDTLPTTKESLPEYKKFAPLALETIWVSEAARKYKIPHQHLSRYAKTGIIRIIKKDGNRTLLKEQDVAYVSEIYHRGSLQGKRLFRSDGTPYGR
jgi:predicted site-specific integrase-resolvase